jgi:hypothetical protein
VCVFRRDSTETMRERVGATRPAAWRTYGGCAFTPRTETRLHKTRMLTQYSIQSGARTVARGRLYVCNAFGPDPYEPLERAIQVINRVLSVGERNHKRRKTEEMGNDVKEIKGKQGQRERWVQFGAVTLARVPLAECLIPGLADDYETVSLLLQEYLALPVDQYALLDPKWVERETTVIPGDCDISSPCETDDSLYIHGSKEKVVGNAFRVSVPLEEMLGIELRPQLSITARPDREAGNVTLVGSKAGLGSPEFDQAFKLNLVAVLSRRKRNGGLHIPGRPVQRLRRWAARRRDRAVQIQIQAEEQEELSSIGTTTEEIDVNDLATSAPFPMQQVYMSQDEEELQREEGGFVEVNVNQGSGDHPVSVMEAPSYEREESETSVATSVSPSLNKRASNHLATLLDCRVNVTVAVKVPGPLRVVPNPLLGYAGSLIVRSALNAAVPNFVNLLLGDFRRWAKAGRKRVDVDDAYDGLLEPTGDEWKGGVDLFGITPTEESQVNRQRQISQ